MEREASSGIAPQSRFNRDHDSYGPGCDERSSWTKLLRVRLRAPTNAYTGLASTSLDAHCWQVVVDRGDIVEPLRSSAVTATILRYAVLQSAAEAVAGVAVLPAALLDPCVSRCRAAVISGPYVSSLLLLPSALKTVLHRASVGAGEASQLVWVFSNSLLLTVGQGAANHHATAILVQSLERFEGSRSFQFEPVLVDLNG